MSEPTFKEALEELVKETEKVTQEMTEGLSMNKAEYEFHDVLGYQVLITIGKDILEEEEEESYEEDGY